MLFWLTLTAFAIDPTPPGPLSIVNGAATTLHHHPAAGGLLVQADMSVASPFGGAAQDVEIKQFVCSSTLIAPDVVLTAAHCVDEYVLAQGGEVRSIAFRWSRQTDLTSPAAPGEPWPDDAIAVRSWVTPNDWDISNINVFTLDAPKYDLALLFLEEPVLDVTPAALIEATDRDLIQEGAAVEIVGWGLQTAVTVWESLLPPEEGTFGLKYFGPSTLHEIGEWEIQVGDGDESRKCKGDSGGPTFMNVGSVPFPDYRLIGVTSRSADFTQCAERGGFDTRVDAYLDWINKQMSDACADGTRVWCDEPGILPPDFFAPASAEPTGCDAGGQAGWLSALALLVGRRRARR